MSKYKTHQTEHDFKFVRSIEKKSSVRSGQTQSLKNLVASAQRGMLPDSVTFKKMDSQGFIPPQYDRSHLSERYDRMKAIAHELHDIAQQSKNNIVDDGKSTVVDPKSTDVNPAE